MVNQAVDNLIQVQDDKAYFGVSKGNNHLFELGASWLDDPKGLAIIANLRNFIEIITSFSSCIDA